MRVFKFRVWEESEKRFFFPYSLAHLSAADLNSPNMVQQFTGALDSKGKEIYEGDILRIDYEYETNGEIHTNTSTGEVYWSEGEYSYLLTRGWEGFNYLSDYRGNCYTVIGNIFEK